MPRPGEVTSHWHHFVENFNTSTLDFYKSVEQTLTAKESPVRPTRVDWAEGGILSAKREYLRATYGRYSFDIAAFPFGKDFFFSWWLTKRQPEGALGMGCMAMIGLLIALTVFVTLLGPIAGFVVFFIGVAALWSAIASGAIVGAALADDIMLSLPVVGSLYSRYIRPVTYFSEDTWLVFQESVHKVMTRHVETVLSVAKLPPLTPEQAKIRPGDRTP